MSSSDGADSPTNARMVVGRRLASHFLEKVRGYIAAYERGGEARKQAIEALEANWAQIERSQRWAVEFCDADPLALEICHLFAERSDVLLPLISSDRAINLLEPAIQAAQRLRLHNAELGHQRNLGLIYDRAGRYEDALASYRAALALATEQNTLGSRADLLHRIGKVHRNLGKHRAAEGERWYREALEAMQQAGDLCGEARVRTDLGNIRANQGFYTEALKLYEPARELLARPECGDTSDEAMLLGYLGNANRNLGRYQAAEEAYLAAAAMSQALHDNKTWAEHLFNLALLYRDVGRLGAMYERLEASKKVAERYKGERDKKKVQNGLGLYHGLCGQFDEALSEHDDALAYLERANAHFLADYVRADKGRTLLIAGRAAEALALLGPGSGEAGGTAHPLHRQQRGALVAQAHLLLGNPTAALGVLVDARAADGDPNTAASRHRTAALHGITLALLGDHQARSVLEQAAGYSGERIAADAWELGALVSRGLSACALALLGEESEGGSYLQAAHGDLAQATQRCAGKGFRAEILALIGVLGPLDGSGRLPSLRAQLAQPTDQSG